MSLSAGKKSGLSHSLSEPWSFCKGPITLPKVQLALTVMLDFQCQILQQTTACDWKSSMVSCCRWFVVLRKNFQKVKSHKVKYIFQVFNYLFIYIPKLSTVLGGTDEARWEMWGDNREWKAFKGQSQKLNVSSICGVYTQTNQHSGKKFSKCFLTSLHFVTDPLGMLLIVLPHCIRYLSIKAHSCPYAQ